MEPPLHLQDMTERSCGTISWLASHLYLAVTKGKRTPAILPGNGPPMAEALVLLKGYGACLRY